MHVPCRKTIPAAHTGLAVQTVTSLQGISNSAHGVCYLLGQNEIALMGKFFQVFAKHDGMFTD